MRIEKRINVLSLPRKHSSSYLYDRQFRLYRVKLSARCLRICTTELRSAVCARTRFKRKLQISTQRFRVNYASFARFLHSSTPTRSYDISANSTIEEKNRNKVNNKSEKTAETVVKGNKD